MANKSPNYQISEKCSALKRVGRVNLSVGSENEWQVSVLNKFSVKVLWTYFSKEVVNVGIDNSISKSHTLFLHVDSENKNEAIMSPLKKHEGRWSLSRWKLNPLACAPSMGFWLIFQQVAWTINKISANINFWSQGLQTMLCIIQEEIS